MPPPSPLRFRDSRETPLYQSPTPSSRQASDQILSPETARSNPSARRITIVLHDLSGGGTEHVAIRLANRWAKAGRAVTVFCGVAQGVLRSVISAEVKVVEAVPRCPRKPLSRLLLAMCLTRFVRANPQDVVFAPGNFHIPILAVFVRQLPSVATVCKISNELVQARKNVLLQWLRQRYLNWAVGGFTGLVAMSPSQYRAARAILPQSPIMMAWEPILEMDQLSFPRSMERPIILAIGRLEKQKNFKLALQAFALFRKFYDAELVFLGEGSERKKLQRLAKRLGISTDVSFLGHRGTVQSYLARASVLLMTSRFEGFPAVLVEAVAMSVPIVTTPCSEAIPEIVPEGYPARIAPAQPESIAKALGEIFAADPSTTILPQMEFIRRHSVESASAAYLDVLDEVVRRKAMNS